MGGTEVTQNDLKRARELLLGLHAQADHSPRHKHRLPAIRAALACVELVQQAAEPPPPVKVARLSRPYDQTEFVAHYAETRMEAA